jgi:hypothetical protein
MQEGNPLAFYSRKLNSAQTRYTTGEQELLSILETLKEFRDILLGQQVIVFGELENVLSTEQCRYNVPSKNKNLPTNI